MNNPVSAYKKYLKYVKETAQKDPAKLAPEVGGIVVGSELIHRGLRRKLKEVKEKNNENDSENLETDNRTEKAGGGVSQGLDYLTGIERRGYAGGSILKTIGKKIIKKTKKPNLKRQLTDDEIDDLAADVGDLDAYLDFDGTVGSAEKIRKQHKEYMDYMYYQYKTGRLDPKPGEMNTSRMQYLRNKRKQAEMTDDPKLFNPNERDELDNLEETFSPMGTSNKINISDPKTAESFTEFAKQNDPEGFKKIEKIVDDINNKNTLENFDITGRKKNAGGGILKTIGKKLIKKPKKYKFTGEESLNDLYELERQGKITREDMNVYSPRYLEYLDAQIINKEKLYTPKEWEKTPEVLKNKMRGRIDPDWEEANFGEEFNWDQARSMEIKQQKQLQDFDITGRKKNAKGGLNYLMGL
jgi:hypothetical protein